MPLMRGAPWLPLPICGCHPLCRLAIPQSARLPGTEPTRHREQRRCMRSDLLRLRQFRAILVRHGSGAHVGVEASGIDEVHAHGGARGLQCVRSFASISSAALEMAYGPRPGLDSSPRSTSASRPVRLRTGAVAGRRRARAASWPSGSFRASRARRIGDVEPVTCSRTEYARVGNEHVEPTQVRATIAERRSTLGCPGRSAALSSPVRPLQCAPLTPRATCRFAPPAGHAFRRRRGSRRRRLRARARHRSREQCARAVLRRSWRQCLRLLTKGLCHVAVRNVGHAPQTAQHVGEQRLLAHDEEQGRRIDDQHRSAGERQAHDRIGMERQQSAAREARLLRPLGRRRAGARPR